MALSIKQRWEIIFLALHPLGPKLSYDDIGKHIHCSKSTVSDWIKTYKETGDVQDKEGRGRKRATTEKEDTLIVKMAKIDDANSAPKIRSKLVKRGINLSPQTIRNRLHEAGGVYSYPLAKPLLNQDQMEKRLNFAKDNLDRDWSNVIFTDESTFQLFTYKRKVWRFGLQGIVRRTVKHPPKIHVWGCFNESGFGEIYLFSENLNGTLLTKIYQKALLPSVNKLIENPESGWVLQEDNDPKHKSKIATKWRLDNGVDRLKWASASPDLNPIENVWSLLKAKVEEKNCSTIKQLRAEIKKQRRALPNDYAINLVKSLKKRLLAVIANNGDFTLY